MAVGGCLHIFELSGLEELQLAECEICVALGRASLVLHFRRRLVANDAVRVILFGSGCVGVGGEVEEHHRGPMNVLDRGHVCLDLTEEDGNRIGITSVIFLR